MLRQIAGELNIPGRSKMNKGELLLAIQQSQQRGGAAVGAPFFHAQFGGATVGAPLYTNQFGGAAVGAPFFAPAFGK